MPPSEAPLDPQRLQQWSCQRQLGQLRIPVQYLEQNQYLPLVALAHEARMITGYLLLVLATGTLTPQGLNLGQGALSALLALLGLALWPRMSVSGRWLHRVRSQMHRGLRYPGLRPVRRRIHRWQPPPPRRSKAYPWLMAALGLSWLALLRPQPDTLLLFSLHSAVLGWSLSRMAQGRDRMAYLWMWATRVHHGLATLYQQQRKVLAQLLPAAPMPPEHTATVRETWSQALRHRNRERRHCVLGLLLLAGLDAYCLPGQIYSTLLLIFPPLMMLKSLMILLADRLRQWCFQGWDRSDRHAGYGLFLPEVGLWSWLQLTRWGYIQFIHRATLLGLGAVLLLFWRQPLAMLGLVAGLVLAIIWADSWIEAEVRLFEIAELERNIPGSDLCSGPPAPPPEAAPRIRARLRLRRKSPGQIC